MFNLNCENEEKQPSFKMESGSPEEGALTHTTCRSQLLDPGQEEALSTTPAGGRFSPWPATAQPMRNQCAQQMRSCHHPELLLSSNGLLFKAAPPEFLLFLTYQRMLAFKQIPLPLPKSLLVKEGNL